MVRSGLALLNDEAISDCSKSISTGIVRCVLMHLISLGYM